MVGEERVVDESNLGDRNIGDFGEIVDLGGMGELDIGKERLLIELSRASRTVRYRQPC